MTHPDGLRNGEVPQPPSRIVAPKDEADGSASTVQAPASTGITTPDPEDPDATVGTGSAIALGCIAATLLLIVVGLVFLAIVAFLN